MVQEKNTSSGFRDILENLSVIGYGKIFFIPRNHTVPALPDMNLIILKDNDNYQAICIDIELDSVGENVDIACDNLKDRLLAYTTQMVENYNSDIKAAAAEIIGIAYSRSETKRHLFNMYAQAKQQHLLSRLKKENKVKSRLEDLGVAFNRLFQFEPIGFKLTLAAGIV